MADSKEPGQRAYEAFVRALGDDPDKTWPTGEAPYKRAWAAVEQGCAVPAEAGQSEAWVSVLAMGLQERIDDIPDQHSHACSAYDHGKRYAFQCALAMLNKLAPPPKSSEGGE